MLRGNLRKGIAGGILVLCLVLVLPGSAQARPMERPSVHEQATYGIWARVTFWQEELWRRIVSLWDKSSVLIIPEGGTEETDEESEETEGGG